MQSEEIDEIADRFENALRDNGRPEIEDFLPEEAELRDRLLAELLAIEIELRQSNGEIVMIDQYLLRFPEDLATVEHAFQLLSPENTIGDNEDTDPGGPLPEKLGRYEIIQRLGQGGFGTVLLARDEQLDRLVALKLPRDKRNFESKQDLDRFVQEAKVAANLKHPSLVTIYDVQVEDGLPYIVQEYIEGSELGSWAQENSPSHRELALVFIEICEAIAYAHELKLYHCDLKLGNVLMDSLNHPHVADFGLAVHENSLHQRRGAIVGTPTMMAPEQVRGEGHRVEGRTDIWAIGVMIYELLAGRKPFVATERKDLFDQILSLDPKPPRQIDRSIPRELERICLQCLAKRKTERYSSADSLRDDLRQWVDAKVSTRGDTPAFTSLTDFDVATTSPLSSDSKLVPKGLRSYETEDAEFFLELLPGPRDRHGLPSSVRNWKHRIESTDPDRRFSVGLICGPSGSGKTSLVKAGILPRLSHDIMTVFVEATPSNLEAQILDQLKRRIPNLAKEESLSTACAKLRSSGSGDTEKVLIVIDQFEQWLFSGKAIGSAPLVDALRQSDGENLQTLLLVRDDFYLSVARVFHELEVRLAENRNCSIVDLFDLKHAKKVLSELGKAYGKFDEDLTPEQEMFVATAVKELADGQRVICVRLTLFAEMLKLRPWTQQTLDQVGGIQGVGAAFLDEMFTSPASSPMARTYHKQARDCLAAMLPEFGTDIKRKQVSASRMSHISGFDNDPRRFEELLSLLRDDLKLISTVDSSADFEGQDDEGGQKAMYQLTHDYLVPALRQWIWEERNRRGKANRKLAELSARWNADQQRRNLPNLAEFANILGFTRKAGWSEPQRRMMKVASRRHLRGLGLAAVIASLLVWMGLIWTADQHNQNEIAKVRLAVDNLQFSDALKSLKGLDQSLVLSELLSRFDSKVYDSTNLILAVALAQNGHYATEYLIQSISTADDSEFRLVINVLETDPNVDHQHVIDETRRVGTLSGFKKTSDWHVKARFAIALLHLGNPLLAHEMLRAESREGEYIQRREFIYSLERYRGNVDTFAPTLRDARDSYLRSGICLALGGRDPDAITVDAWMPVLKDWYLDQPDSGTHSAADYVLRKWNIRLPLINDAESASDRKWTHTPSGLVMINVHPGKIETEDGAVEITKSFALADREVTESQLLDCIRELQGQNQETTDWFAEATRRGAQHAAGDVTFYDAMMFCNWLSEKEALPCCYEVKDSMWTFNDTGGYRLPFVDEWEYACRAGTRSEYWFGNLPQQMYEYDYGTCRENVAQKTTLVGASKCNPWGFFDLHGNIREWCQQREVRFSLPVKENVAGARLRTNLENVLGTGGKIISGAFSSYPQRGGGSYTFARDCASSSPWAHEYWRRWDENGFRVARTLHKTPANAGPSADTMKDFFE
ncbi:MAG: protein kinase [Planctomycetota bacterium]